jgi:hypothetical protein
MPEFALHEGTDIRQYVVQTCLKSELCRAKFPQMSPEFADKLLPAILDPNNQNPCKLLFKFLSTTGKYNLHATINSAVRFMAHKQSKSRGVILPMLYSLAYCPSIDDFVKFSTHYMELVANYSDDIPATSCPVPTLHASLYPQTNRFVGAHIRLSEYFANTPERASICLDRGYLNESNWSDACGMISDYKEDFRSFFYQPEPACPRREDLAQSPTRVVILTGKWDTQTPHDLAQREFDSLLAPNKFIFSADHAGHGVIDTSEVPGFFLHLALEFVVTGSAGSLAQITQVFARHNEDADSVWRMLQREDSTFKHLWSLHVKAKNYSWTSFAVVLLGSFVPPVLTLLFFRKIKLK